MKRSGPRRRRHPIIAIDTLAHKEALAREFDATHFVLADGDVPAKIRSIVPYSDTADMGRSQPAGRLGVRVQQPSGRAAYRHRLARVGRPAVIVGVPAQGTEISVPVNPMGLDRRIMGVRYGDRAPADIPLIIGLYQQDRFKLDEMVTRTYPLEDWEQEARHARQRAWRVGALFERTPSLETEHDRRATFRRMGEAQADYGQCASLRNEIRDEFDRILRLLREIDGISIGSEISRLDLAADSGAHRRGPTPRPW